MLRHVGVGLQRPREGKLSSEYEAKVVQHDESIVTYAVPVAHRWSAYF